MRNFVVVERDTDPERVAEMASAVGFVDVLLGAYSPTPVLMPPAAMEHGLRDGFGGLLDAAARQFHVDHRLLVLRKAGTEAVDSRRRDRLAARLEVDLTATGGRATITNTGVATWRPSGGESGSVNLGAHALAADGALLDLDALRVPLTTPARPIEPGQTVVVEFALPALPPGTTALEFDLVSEGVAWFGDVGSATHTATVPEGA
jgi:hypothetical protein